MVNFVRVHIVEFQGVEDGIQGEQQKGALKGISPTPSADDAVQIIG